MKQIIETINRYKAKSADHLNNQQIAYIPTVNSDQIECLINSYLIDGKRTIIDQANQVCFKLRYLNFKPMEPRKAIKYKNGSWSIADLVNDDVILPFILFINGVFIPWETITLAIGQENYYVISDLTSLKGDKDIYNNFASTIRNVRFAQIVQLPACANYKPNGDIDKSIFSFDLRGRFEPLKVNTPKYVFEISDGNHIACAKWRTTDPINAFKVMEKSRLKLVKGNISLFKNGLFSTGTLEKIKKAFDGNHKDEATGKVTPCLDLVTDDSELVQNPKVKLDSSLLSVANGSNEDSSMYDIVLTINYKYTDTTDNIFKAELEALKPLIESQNSGESNPEYLRQLQTPFEMQMSRKKYYDQNVADCIQKMMSYDASLFNSVYKDISNLKIEEHTGQWLLDQVDLDGTVKLSRQHNHMTDEYILILVNGQMYKYYYMCKYLANKYIVPVQGISSNDIIEILRFENVNNCVTDIVINEDDGFKNISNEIINENMILFSTETDLDYFDFPANGLQHFPVEYTLETDEDDNVKITLANPFYYGKSLKVAYKNRFQHFWYNLEETTDKYTVDLGNKFMYCNEYAKFLIFYNGRRLGSDHYRLTLPVRPTTPFSTFNIYLTLPIQKGDRLDVVYVPSLMSDVTMIPEAELSGDIVVDKSLLDYGLSTDLYMVWVNGKKVPGSHIADIDSRHMRILTDQKSTKTLCVTKYIPSVEELTSVFKDNEALWDKVISQLTNEEIYKLLGIEGGVLSDTEESVYANAVSIKAIMYELVREQFMMNPRVDVTNAFIYDYQDVDKTIIESRDSANNAILPVADANRTDNLDNVERPWP